jgi:hypothetical protein
MGDISTASRGIVVSEGRAYGTQLGIGSWTLFVDLIYHGLEFLNNNPATKMEEWATAVLQHVTHDDASSRSPIFAGLSPPLMSTLAIRRPDAVYTLPAEQARVIDVELAQLSAAAADTPPSLPLSRASTLADMSSQLERVVPGHERLKALGRLLPRHRTGVESGCSDEAGLRRWRVAIARFRTAAEKGVVAAMVLVCGAMLLLVGGHCCRAGERTLQPASEEGSSAVVPLVLGDVLLIRRPDGLQVGSFGIGVIVGSVLCAIVACWRVSWLTCWPAQCRWSTRW